jgi:hypothetical protein
MNFSVSSSRTAATAYLTTAVMIQIMSTEPTTLKTEMCKQILYNAHVNDNIRQVTWTRSTS